MAALSLAGFSACSRNSGDVERRAAGLDRIVPAGAHVERLAGGFAFTEGPLWTPEGALLFGDLPNNVIRKWTPDGTVTVLRTRSGYADADTPPGVAMGSNGMAFDRQGRLTVCEPGNRRVTRVEPDGSVTVLAERYAGKRFNSPNDLVYKSDGSIYFTDPPHGLVGEDGDPRKELAFNGIFRIVGGTVELLSDAMNRPNGLAFSPDERYLYVANSDARRKIWMRYDVQPDGSLAGGRMFLELDGIDGQEPDGMKVDRDGNLYCSGPGGLWIVAPDATVLGVIHPPREPSNCAWGDPDRRTLYMTGRDEIYRIRLAIPGAGS